MLLLVKHQVCIPKKQQSFDEFRWAENDKTLKISQNKGWQSKIQKSAKIYPHSGYHCRYNHVDTRIWIHRKDWHIGLWYCNCWDWEHTRPRLKSIQIPDMLSKAPKKTFFFFSWVFTFTKDPISDETLLTCARVWPNCIHTMSISLAFIDTISALIYVCVEQEQLPVGSVQIRCSTNKSAIPLHILFPWFPWIL